ncbi:hypothetical protein RF11_13912 [Thelohanellus kitauei]|uniref:Uncharacterized protein n=1 Tax=Thelohanellus kitauei TaxID=669202 RepID=A0A0C2M9D8_THEKT|nr:hypothetical protein RF11_13912 [Thelohanellus kitauei]
MYRANGKRAKNCEQLTGIFTCPELAVFSAHTISRSRSRRSDFVIQSSSPIELLEPLYWPDSVAVGYSAVSGAPEEVLYFLGLVSPNPDSGAALPELALLGL